MKTELKLKHTENISKYKKIIGFGILFLLVILVTIIFVFTFDGTLHMINNNIIILSLFIVLIIISIIFVVNEIYF